MNSTILVTGGTGTLGRLVVSRLRDGGSWLRVAGRHAPPPEPGIGFARYDLDTGDGVEAALSGVRPVVLWAQLSKSSTTGGCRAACLARAAGSMTSTA